MCGNALDSRGKPAVSPIAVARLSTREKQKRGDFETPPYPIEGRQSNYTEFCRHCVVNLSLYEVLVTFVSNLAFCNQALF